MKVFKTIDYVVKLSEKKARENEERKREKKYKE